MKAQVTHVNETAFLHTGFADGAEVYGFYNDDEGNLLLVTQKVVNGLEKDKMFGVIKTPNGALSGIFFEQNELNPLHGTGTKWTLIRLSASEQEINKSLMLGWMNQFYAPFFSTDLV